MKIGNPADKLPPAAVTNGQASANGASHAAQARSVPAVQADASAKIELSNAAASLLSDDTSPEFDAAKVASVSQAIDDGSYQVDPGAIADKLISNAQELLGNVQP